MGQNSYSVNGTVAVAAATQTIINLFTDGNVRPEIYDLVLGFDAAADNQHKVRLNRTTALGTEGSGFTPLPQDPDDRAASSDSGIGDFNTEPTHTASSQLLEFYMNQRSTQRWVAAPGRNLVIPATASNGIAVRVEHASATPNVDATLMFIE